MTTCSKYVEVVEATSLTKLGIWVGMRHPDLDPDR